MDTYKARELILALVDEKLADSRVGLNDKDMNGLKEWAERLPESPNRPVGSRGGLLYGQTVATAVAAP
jgi:hypothetical protein